MNIYDIASKAGVSVATVSRVLNNSPRVSQKSKEKVQRIMDEEGYVPNIFARGLSLNSVKSIGILCPVISDINHAAAVSHIERLLRT
ncbi:MAG: LacI family DNA-binding transcriptional regulator, partial [Spirochaetales bacterium]|nr:LacI family DNA-binding transcriptional regulator [Spirochaetales bacterium]